MKLNPYLYFNGNCEAAFKAYARILGGKILAMMTYDATPAKGQVSPEWGAKIIHARLGVGDLLLMGSDAPPGKFDTPQGFSVTFSVDTAADAERIFKALSEKGAVKMAMAETFFAHRYGMVVDQFGTPWIIIFEKPMPASKN
jgi:PhnB protein